MPHVSIQYSPQLDDSHDMTELCHTLNEAIVETALFPLAGATGSAGIAAGMAYGFILLATSLPGLIWMLTSLQGPTGARTALAQAFKGSVSWGTSGRS